MRVKKSMSMLIILCFSMLWPVYAYAQEDVSDINEHEQRVIDYAMSQGYKTRKNGVVTYYAVTESGRAALERKMRRVAWTREDADMVINSEPTEADLQEQLEKGYIYVYSVDDPSKDDDNSEENIDNPGGNIDNPEDNAVDFDGNITKPDNNKKPSEEIEDNKIEESQKIENSDNQQSIVDSNGNSNMVAEDNNEKISNISGQAQSIFQSSQNKALAIWNAVISDSNSNGKQNSSGNGADKKESSQNKTSNSAKESNSDSTTSLIKETLSQIEKENREKSKFSSYKMISQEDADIKIECTPNSDEVKILDKNGNLILSYTDSNVTSKGIEGNIIHIEWLIPVALILLFISLACVYIGIRRGYYARATKDGMPSSKKGRNILSIIMRLVLIICILVVFIIASLFSGMFRSSNIIQALNNSSYYEYAYAEMAKNTVRILEENNIDSLVLADILDYDNFILVIKQQIEKQVSTLDGEMNIEKTQEDIKTKLNEYYKNQEEKKIAESETEETKEEKKDKKVQRKEKVNIITNSIMSNYKEYADFYPSHFIRQLKRDLRAVLQIVFPVVCFTILINMVALYYLFQRRYKGIGYIGGSMAVSGLIACIVSAIIYTKQPYTKLYLSPEYLYHFLLTYLDNGIKPFFIISVLLVILSITILALNKILFPKKHRR
ncbi:MAG: hypothetical protein ACI4F9_06265 [Lachnospiraceae bacterium]